MTSLPIFLMVHKLIIMKSEYFLAGTRSYFRTSLIQIKWYFILNLYCFYTFRTTDMDKKYSFINSHTRWINLIITSLKRTNKNSPSDIVRDISNTRKRLQAHSKHKMTGGWGRASGPHYLPHPTQVHQLKHTSWYMSDHYICLEYLLFLSLIFRLWWLWRNRELVWVIVRQNICQTISFAFLVISIRLQASEYLFHACEHVTSWGSSVSCCLAQIRLPRLKAENHFSPTALVAGMTSIERQLVKAPLVAAISSYLISLTYPTYAWNAG